MLCRNLSSLVQSRKESQERKPTPLTKHRDSECTSQFLVGGQAPIGASIVQSLCFLLLVSRCKNPKASWSADSKLVTLVNAVVKCLRVCNVVTGWRAF